ncbi:hypothetical protein [Salinicoccus albus]|uniref:hypothetical protein n=1 Tax=Salinicoccus albus TaxID=418756 RepID=UPI0003745671|nr:hypothetical protein [Salinicoccus albus]
MVHTALLNYDKNVIYDHRENNVECKAPSWKQSNSTYNSIFYVGSSDKLKKRMREHIYGYSDKGNLYKTSGLKLQPYVEKTLKYNTVHVVVESILDSALPPPLGTARQS